MQYGQLHTNFNAEAALAAGEGLSVSVCFCGRFLLELQVNCEMGEERTARSLALRALHQSRTFTGVLEL